MDGKLIHDSNCRSKNEQLQPLIFHSSNDTTLMSAIKTMTLCDFILKHVALYQLIICALSGESMQWLSVELNGK